MMMTTFKNAITLALFGALFVGCGPEEGGDTPADGSGEQGALDVQRDAQVKGGVDGKADSSVVATFVDMSFKGSLITNSSWRPESQIEDQLLYTIGHLNGDNGVGRLDKLSLSNVEVTRTMDGKTRIDYDATLLVAWGKRGDVPSEYELVLPFDVSSTSLNTFAEKYGESCVDWGAHDVTSGSMWYYYRPNSSRCRFDEADIIRVPASLEVSDVNTTGKYPEYHKVWEDDVLKVVAIFGKYEDNSTSNSDAGIAAYNSFLGAVKQRFAGDMLVTEPAEVPSNPGVNLTDVTFRATLATGRQVEIVALMVDNVRTAGADFNARYTTLSGDADFIAYNGHAGLGANIRALAQKGSWSPGQYSIVFMNGCDTYAYVDSALFDARAEVNADDPTGTKHLDIVTNALPSFFSNMTKSTMAFVDGLSNPAEPMTYEEIFRNISSSQVVLVSGEEDNVFVPGYDGDMPPAPEQWTGLEDAGKLARNEEFHVSTPVIEAGTYVFEITGSGDADLYVRIGEAPTLERYDCRPYRAGSQETCVVELSSPTSVHVMVQGYASSSEFNLTGRRD